MACVQVGIDKRTVVGDEPKRKNSKLVAEFEEKREDRHKYPQ